MPRRFGLPLLAALTLFNAPPASADDAAAIRDRLMLWMQQFNSRDAAGACELFSKELVSDVRGQGEAGYDTRCALITKALGDPARRFRYTPDIREIIVDGDLAVVRLTWTLSIDPGDVTVREPGLDVFRREADGRWRIIRFMAFEAE